ncbi:hypothetical protein CEUSTIGMA_g5384.t1 [Chlamydomonas eustigma]|uniref:Uncharacterized protein n=1 Tax=Chlamydomonas eustigma TaxID=1157962 RepID=A0A250X4X7_9CHLO|nr:hypothetical protein CEUSTIGMA_g5384.t1 [Chlamydomonas eustigma]|eukprot:GAX77942.1 hypothetical protein CEUSTIGMA_g5384.t1 [Chlamydomonas eustigma]
MRTNNVAVSSSNPPTIGSREAPHKNAQRGRGPCNSSMRIPALLLGDVFMTCNTLSSILSSEERIDLGENSVSSNSSKSRSVTHDSDSIYHRDAKGHISGHLDTNYLSGSSMQVPSSSASQARGPQLSLDPATKLLVQLAVPVEGMRFMFTSKDTAEGIRKALVLERYEEILEQRELRREMKKEIKELMDEETSWGPLSAAARLRDWVLDVLPWRDSEDDSPDAEDDAFINMLVSSQLRGGFKHLATGQQLGLPLSAGLLDPSPSASNTLLSLGKSSHHLSTMVSELRRLDEETVLLEGSYLTKQATSGSSSREHQQLPWWSLSRLLPWSWHDEDHSNSLISAGPPSSSYVARLPLEPAMQLLMHRPHHFKMAPTVADAKSVQAVDIMDSSCCASGSGNRGVIRAYLEVLKAGPDAFKLEVQREGPQTVLSGKKQRLHSKFRAGHSTEGMRTGNKEGEVAIKSSDQSATISGKQDSFASREISVSGEGEKGFSKGMMGMPRSDYTAVSSSSKGMELSDGIRDQSSSAGLSEETITGEDNDVALISKTPVFFVPGITLHVACPSLPQGGAPMSFTPAFLSLKQLAVVLQEGRKHAARAWLDQRRQDRQRWVDGMEAVALLVSGLAPGLLPPLLKDEAEDAEEEDDSHADLPESKQLMQELGEGGSGGSKSPLLVTLPPLSPPQGLLALANTTAVGMVSVASQGLCAVADLLDAGIMASPLSPLILQLPERLNVRTAYLEDWMEDQRQRQSFTVSSSYLAASPAGGVRSKRTKSNAHPPDSTSPDAAAAPMNKSIASSSSSAAESATSRATAPRTSDVMPNCSNCSLPTRNTLSGSSEGGLLARTELEAPASASSGQPSDDSTTISAGQHNEDEASSIRGASPSLPSTATEHSTHHLPDTKSAGHSVGKTQSRQSASPRSVAAAVDDSAVVMAPEVKAALSVLLAGAWSSFRGGNIFDEEESSNSLTSGLFAQLMKSKLGEANPAANGEFVVRMAVEMASVTYKKIQQPPASSTTSSTTAPRSSPSSLSVPSSGPSTHTPPSPASTPHPSRPSAPIASSSGIDSSSGTAASPSIPSDNPTTTSHGSTLSPSSPNHHGSSSARVGRQAQPVETELKKHTVEVGLHVHMGKLTGSVPENTRNTLPVFASTAASHSEVLLPGVLLIGDLGICEESEESLFGGDTDSLIMQHRPPSLGFTDLAPFASSTSEHLKRKQTSSAALYLSSSGRNN